MLIPLVLMRIAEDSSVDIVVIRCEQFDVFIGEKLMQRFDVLGVRI